MVATGALLLYSALAEDHNPLTALRSILSGTKPAPLPTGKDPAAGGSGGGGGGAAPPGSVHGPNPELETYLRGVSLAHRWTPAQTDDWVWLANHENDTWDPRRKNPGSTATGIGQFLDSTWASVGAVKTFDAHTQIDLMGTYIARRYTDPSRAKAFWLANNWY